MELYHNDNFLELLYSETFWVAIAFFIFVVLSFKKAKKVLIESLDKRIEEIKKRINNGDDIIGRENFFRKVELDETFPKYIIENKKFYQNWIV